MGRGPCLPGFRVAPEHGPGHSEGDALLSPCPGICQKAPPTAGCVFFRPPLAVWLWAPISDPPSYCCPAPRQCGLPVSHPHPVINSELALLWGVGLPGHGWGPHGPGAEVAPTPDLPSFPPEP